MWHVGTIETEQIVGFTTRAELLQRYFKEDGFVLLPWLSCLCFFWVLVMSQY